MTPGELRERLRHDRVVAILRGVPSTVVEPVVEALVAGGIRVVEITLDHPDAGESLERLAARDDILLGAGTARTPGDVDVAAASGAAFVVSPATVPAVVVRCHEHGLPAIPGAFTPTEVETAWRLGAAVVKLFPGGGVGPAYIREVLAPLADVPLLVTGGVDERNARAFLDAGALAVGAGSSLAPRAAIAAGDWAAVTAAARSLTRSLTN
jgi:2-dehydro-3-deoxyphosphogluconate aldolase/(4S)-4-hydroxy-2-oxoglutarate aldolase